MIAVAVVNLAIGAGGAILVLLALDELGMSEIGFGLLIGAGAVGGFVGTLAAKPVTRRVGWNRAMAGSTLLLAFGQLVVGTASNAWIAAAGLALGFFGISVFSVVGRSLRQAITPDRILGRVVTTFRFIGMGTVPLGALLGGAVADVAGLRVPYLAGSLLIAGTAILVYRALTDERIAAALARKATQ